MQRLAWSAGLDRCLVLLLGLVGLPLAVRPTTAAQAAHPASGRPVTGALLRVCPNARGGYITYTLKLQVLFGNKGEKPVDCASHRGPGCG
jgi:hypothetical protein